MDFRFRVFGVITDAATGEPLPGLVVRGFDRDLVFDDHLGEATTDAAGRFEIRYTDEAFRSIVDEQPDLYLQVWGASGEHQLFTTANAVRWNAGSEEYYEIAIPSPSGSA